jgi:hypothetical protein
VAREFRKDFVPVRVSGPDVGGIFRKRARNIGVFAFMDNGSTGNFISQALCDKLGTIPRKLVKDHPGYRGPTGEHLAIEGEVRLQLCWQYQSNPDVPVTISDRFPKGTFLGRPYQNGKIISFKVVKDLTLEMIVTFEMATATGMDRIAGPLPREAAPDIVAPISSPILPFRNKQQLMANQTFKEQQRLENQKADNLKNLKPKSSEQPDPDRSGQYTLRPETRTTYNKPKGKNVYDPWH